MKVAIRAIAGLLAAGLAGAAFAEVSTDEAKQLGGALTYMGAEKAGNKDGTIPEYTGQVLKVVIDPKNPGLRSDPFANEKPLFSITAQNAAKYADKLDGMIEMFKIHPNYRMDVYPTHRTSTLPKYVIDNTLKNAIRCKGTQNDLILVGCYGGIPFPIPKSGTQVMWNHLTAFEFYTQSTNSNSFVVPTSGNPVLVNGAVGAQQWPAYEPGRTTPMEGKEQYWQLRLDYTAPARQVGEKLVLLDPFDTINYGRRAYTYIPGQRRVKLAPDLAYDTPAPTAGGSSNMDDAKGWLGALDRFDFKLVGKKEKFIIANSYKYQDPKVCPFEKTLTPKFPNPECVRWELRRVWAVDGTVKPQFRHTSPKRNLFWDEDGFAGGVSENYDASGKLYRVVLVNSFPLGEGNGTNSSSFFTLDMHTGVYTLQGGTSYPGGGFYSIPAKPASYFSPEVLAGEGIR